MSMDARGMYGERRAPGYLSGVMVSWRLEDMVVEAVVMVREKERGSILAQEYRQGLLLPPIATTIPTQLPMHRTHGRGCSLVDGRWLA